MLHAASLRAADCLPEVAAASDVDSGDGEFGCRCTLHTTELCDVSASDDGQQLSFSQMCLF